MSLRRTVLLVPIAVVCVGACNKDKSSTSTTTTAASAAASTGASGKCTLVVDKAKCLPNGKAAFCNMSTQAGNMEVAWQTVTCPDCTTTDKGGIKCSAYTPGEPCNMLVADDACSKDGKSEFQCDFTTKTWKVEPCPGGCTGDMQKGMMCR